MQETTSALHMCMTTQQAGAVSGTGSLGTNSPLLGMVSALPPWLVSCISVGDHTMMVAYSSLVRCWPGTLLQRPGVWQGPWREEADHSMPWWRSHSHPWAVPLLSDPVKSLTLCHWPSVTHSISVITLSLSVSVTISLYISVTLSLCHCVSIPSLSPLYPLL